MDSWTEVSVDLQQNEYTITLEDVTEGKLSDAVFEQPSRLLYNVDLRAAVAKSELVPYNADEPIGFLQVCLKTGPLYADQDSEWNQFWIYTIDKDTDDLLPTVARLIEKHRSNHNLIIENLRKSVPAVSPPQFTSNTDAPFYDTDQTPYHSHTPTGQERIIEGTLAGSNLQRKHSFALECSECGRITTQPEPNSTLHLVQSEKLAPMRPLFIGSTYWVCNEHQVSSLSEVPHLPEEEWLEKTAFGREHFRSGRYADEHLLVVCNLEWLGLGHPRGEMGVLTCREPEILDREPIS